MVGLILLIRLYMKFTINYHLQEISQKARFILHKFKDIRIFAFYGNLGVGKTTLIRHICNHLGVKTKINSPSFTIINVYKTIDNSPVYHSDFFRIKNISEIYDIGIEEYLYSGYYNFIEWPEIIENILPEKTCVIDIEFKDKEIRKLSISL